MTSIVTIDVSATRTEVGKPFAMVVKVPRVWRTAKGLTEEDIQRIAVAARVCAIDTAMPADLYNTCPRCGGGRPILSVSSTDLVTSFEPKTGTEIHVFNNCRTHCTSSRLHFKSRLAIALEFPGDPDSAPSTETAVSNPFESVSKQKPRRKQLRPDDAADDGNPAPPATAETGSQPPTPAPGHDDARQTQESIQIQRTAVITPPPPPASPLQCRQTTPTPPSFVLRPSQAFMRGTCNQEKQIRRMVIVSSPAAIGATRFAGIRVARVAFTMEEVRPIVERVESALRLDPGFVSYAVDIHDGIGTGVSIFSDEKSSENAHHVLLSMHASSGRSVIICAKIVRF